MSNTPELVSQREFARRLGVNPGMAAKWKNRGVLVMVDGLVDLDASMQALEAARHPAKEYMREVNDRQREKAKAARKQDTRAEKPGPVAAAVAPRPEQKQRESEGEPRLSFNDARTRREHAMACIAELELAERSGDLVARADVERATQGFGRLMRDAFLGIAARIAPSLVPMSTPEAIEFALDLEIRRILEDIAKIGDADIARALNGSGGKPH